MNLLETTTTLESGSILMGLLGGLSLFLFGMEQMTDALKHIAGSGMKGLLARLTTNRFKGIFAGAMVTAIIQSSSVTTVLVVGFISAGLMTLKQSIGVILGTGIGTTITAQIIAFKVTHYALLLVAVGFGMLFVARRKRLQQYGAMVMGLGLIFFGMELMSQSTRPLRDYQPFIDLMRQMDNPLFGILIGTVFTAVVQSSSATMGVIIALASQGLLTLEAGLALAFGANIGTTVTALLASIGQPREALQAAVLHTFFKVVGVLIWLPFIGQLAMVVRWVSPTYTDLSGLAQLAAEAPRQIANAHTIFNVANTFIFIWFTDPLARLMNWLIPLKTEPEKAELTPKYLDKKLLDTPQLALDRVRLELERLGAYTAAMVRDAMPAVFDGSEEDLVALANRDDAVDRLHSAMVSYLGQLSQEDMLSKEAALSAKYLMVANHIESIGDMVETNLVEAGGARLQQQIRMSIATRERLTDLHQQVCWAVDNALLALNTNDSQRATAVMNAKLDINQLASQIESHLSSRLMIHKPNRVAAFRVEVEIVEYLKRVYYFAKRIAKITAQVEQPGLPEEVRTASKTAAAG